MEQHHDLNTMLHKLTQPAFLVDRGLITEVNAAAAACLLQPGQDFSALLETGHEEYEYFTGGNLFVTLSLSGITRDACVTRMEGGDLVTMDPAQSKEILQLLGPLSTYMRRVMNGLMTSADQYIAATGGGNEAAQIYAGQMTRHMYQMVRLIGNMTHAADYPVAGAMETTELCSFVAEIWEKALAQTPLLRSRVTYTLPNEAIFTQVHPENLERAILNLLCNAVKHSPEGSPVQLRLQKKHQRLLLSVSNTLADPEHWVAPYNSFLRQPTLLDVDIGSGLGVVLVQNVAAEHGGALLVERIGDTVRFTLMLPITRSNGTQVRSPILSFDYTGELDHCLVELADVLPAEVYKPENLK